MIRQARPRDLSRIAEILVFVKRSDYRQFFHNDAYSFGELQVLPVAKRYADGDALDHMFVYDDGIVKGLIRVNGQEIAELYVDTFFQGQGIGSALIEYAKEHHSAAFLWVIGKNTRAIRFYEAHGFHLTDRKQVEYGTTEVMMER